MAGKNKYNYLWVIQGYYPGYGWEDLSEYDKKEYSWAGVRHDLKEYRIADPVFMKYNDFRRFRKVYGELQEVKL